MYVYVHRLYDMYTLYTNLYMFHVIITKGDDSTTRSLAAIRMQILIIHYTHHTQNLYDNLYTY